MRLNFEVNTHLVSEICQGNKKRVNIFYSIISEWGLKERSLSSPVPLVVDSASS